jgi:hypothetical protein
MASLDELRQVIRRIEGRHVPRAAPEPIERVVGGEIDAAPYVRYLKEKLGALAAA